MNVDDEKAHSLRVSSVEWMVVGGGKREPDLRGNIEMARSSCDACLT